MAVQDKVRLGDLLVQQKLISQEQLRMALDEQRRSGLKLGRILIHNGFLSEEQLSMALAKQLAIPFVNLKQYSVNGSLSRRLPEALARRFRAILLEERGRGVLVGMEDPTDLFAYDEISRALKAPVELAVVLKDQLQMELDRIYRKTEEISGYVRELEQEFGDEIVDFGMLASSPGLEDAPIVKLLQSIFEDALQVRASDVHIEPQETGLQIRFRIDGVLHVQTRADVKIASALVLRLKLMARLDIAERRLPQDGRFNIRVRDTFVDVRMSTMPTQYGESVVMRLLNQADGILSVDRLGMPSDMLARFREMIQRPNGMVLVTGPTGSGKTTTLYAVLSEVNRDENKVITVEDPVEYRLPGINQVQVNEKIDLSFSRVLRSALRQDPDVILVGEIRDEETAQIGLRAAITGHLVLSTLHTNDAASTPIRLLDMGAPFYLVASSLQLVIAQRLVRLICDSCVETHEPSPQEREWLKAGLGEKAEAFSYQHGKGCSHCNGTGYRGRQGVYEMLEMNDVLVDCISRQDASSFVRFAREQLQGRSLRDHASLLAARGKTTIAEAMRVCNLLED